MRSFYSMRVRQLSFWFATTLALTIPAAAARHHKSTAPKATAKHAAKPKVVGQRTIDDDRATEIQEALIKAGYLTGTPSGHWDSTSEAAMGKLQGDNGWQTKLVPDSRALIKLGLGPSTAANLPNPNPETVAQVGQ
jgi:hypothetical protein